MLYLDLDQMTNKTIAAQNEIEENTKMLNDVHKEVSITFSVEPDRISQKRPSSAHISRFSNVQVCNEFARNMFILTLFEALIKNEIVSIYLQSEPAKLWYRKYNLWISLPIYMIGFLTWWAFACNKDIGKKSPANYLAFVVMLVSKTIFMIDFLNFSLLNKDFLQSLTAGISLDFLKPYESDMLLYDIQVPPVLFACVILFTMQSRFEFKSLSVYFYAFAVVLMNCMLCSLFSRNFCLTFLITVVMFCPQMIVKIFVTKVFMNNERKFDVTPKDFVWSTIHLNFFIVPVFLFFCCCKKIK